MDAGICNAMKTWSIKLAGFEDFPEAIDAVLASLPEDPPTLPHFLALCRDEARKRRDAQPKLAHVATAEERARAEEAAKRAARSISRDRRDHKEWAKRLQARHAAGERLYSAQVSAYSNALGLVPGPVFEEAA